MRKVRLKMLAARSNDVDVLDIEFGAHCRQHFIKEWPCPSFAAILFFMFETSFEYCVCPNGSNVTSLLSHKVVFILSLNLGVSLSDVCYPLISKLACKKIKTIKKNLRRKMPQIPLNDSLGQPDLAERRYFEGSHSIMTLSPKLLPCFLWAGPSPSLTVDTMEGAASCLVIKPIPAPPAKIPNRSRVNPVFTACKQIPGITVASLLLF